ncbi:MAG: hypothetical protein BWY63_03513 [Chloroflexi bacterium ADurb.Bin360]|nr:MAG: hypothetical protein BWY63_03513 [Chloroflexi bacterium ADurb.Bin360]
MEDEGVERCDVIEHLLEIDQGAVAPVDQLHHRGVVGVYRAGRNIRLRQDAFDGSIHFVESTGIELGSDILSNHAHVSRMLGGIVRLVGDLNDPGVA